MELIVHGRDRRHQTHNTEKGTGTSYAAYAISLSKSQVGLAGESADSCPNLNQLLQEKRSFHSDCAEATCAV